MWPALIMGGATLLSGLLGSSAQSDASAAQAQASQAAIDEQRRQYDSMQKLLQPYTQAGVGALTGQQDLMGLNGTDAQGRAISGIAGGPEMAALVQQGENGMLQNASATGGLRGGNLQGALAQYRPQMLSQLINQQYSRLGGLAGLGQASAAGVGAAGMQAGQNIGGYMIDQGRANAAGAMAQGAMWNSIPNAFAAGLGTYTGLGGGATVAAAQPAQVVTNPYYTPGVY
jgi:hypothetical protein